MPDKKYEGRVLTIYFPTRTELQEIQASADSIHAKHSHFAREMIARGMELQTAPRPDLLQESAQAREELSRLRRSLADSEALRQKLETELFAAKHSLFLQPAPTGQGTLSSALVELLQDGHTWQSHEIMKELGIDPKNIDAIKVLAGQLHALQDLHMVVEGTKGWRWTG